MSNLLIRERQGFGDQYASWAIEALPLKGHQRLANNGVDEVLSDAQRRTPRIEAITGFALRQLQWVIIPDLDLEVLPQIGGPVTALYSIETDEAFAIFV